MNKEDKEELSNNIDKYIDRKEYCAKLKAMKDLEEDSIKKGLLEEEYDSVCNGMDLCNEIQRKNTPH